MKKLIIGQFPPVSYPVAEAINTLCTNLSFSGENVRKIMMTSCHASEGKTFLSMNIMRTMARFGKRVVLVDADMRRSMIDARYALEYPAVSEKRGLAHYLAGKADLDKVIYSTDIEGAYMIPVGREVSNPLPLLNSQRLDMLLNKLAQRADYVLVDAPPVGTVIDGAQIAKSCDGTLLVVSYNTVRRKELMDVQLQLEQTGCPILGTVLNMVSYDAYLSRKYYKRPYESGCSGGSHSDSGPGMRDLK